MKKIKEILKNKKVLFSMVGVVLILGILFIINTSFSNTSLRFADYELNNVLISDVTITRDNNISTYTASVSVKENGFVDGFFIKLMDENNNEIAKLYGYVGRNVKENEKVVVSASTNKDISDLKSIIYE